MQHASFSTQTLLLGLWLFETNIALSQNTFPYLIQAWFAQRQPKPLSRRRASAAARDDANPSCKALLDEREARK